VAAYFGATNSRKVRVHSHGTEWVTSAWSTPETTTRSVGNVTKISIGSLRNSGVTAPFNGRIAEVGLWTNVDPDNLDLIVEQLFRGLAPNEIWHQSAPTLYQSLRGDVNESYFGASMTATDVTFEPEDRPIKSHGTVTPPSSNPQTTDDPDVMRFRWPDTGSTPYPLPPYRIVDLDEDQKIQLAADDATGWVGTTVQGAIVTSARQRVILRGAGRAVMVTMAGGASFTPGTSIAYLADDGKCDHSGTVAIGTVSRVDTHNNFAVIIPN
jgi:hypothetical protein